jgi:hypothetical protein
MKADMTAAEFNAGYVVARSGRAVPKPGAGSPRPRIEAQNGKLPGPDPLGYLNPRSPDEGWRDRVLAYRPFVGTLPPEAAICAEFWARVCRHFSAGRMGGVGWHVPLEGRLSRVERATRAAIGAVAGVSDYTFWRRPAVLLCLEIKTERGNLSAAQKDFRSWCEAGGGVFRVARSADEAERLLVEHGFIPATLAEIEGGPVAAPAERREPAP